MGRRKIDIIAKKKHWERMKVYRQRGPGLLKKASELAIMCNSDTALIAYPPDGDCDGDAVKEPKFFPHDPLRMRRVLGRFWIQHPDMVPLSDQVAPDVVPLSDPFIPIASHPAALEEPVVGSNLREILDKHEEIGNCILRYGSKKDIDEQVIRVEAYFERLAIKQEELAQQEKQIDQIGDIPDLNIPARAEEENLMGIDNSEKPPKKKAKYKLRWNSPEDMLFVLQNRPDLRLNAICALYRHEIHMREEMTFRLSDSHFEKISRIVEALTDGSPLGPCIRTADELEDIYRGSIALCSLLVYTYSSQIYQIHAANMDEYF